MPASRLATGCVFPFPSATSICRRIFTICSGVCFLALAIPCSFHTSLSHYHWYRSCRARHRRQPSVGSYTYQMPLLHDGKFTISLYHGTNLLFYDSIKQHGLGGRNVIAELRVIELLRELIAICKRSLPPSDELNAEMCVADLIASQCVHAKGYNWRHGTAYLSATVDKGVRYAATSEFGSEALTCFMRLWMWLHASRVDLPANVTVACEPIVKFASGMKKPL